MGPLSELLELQRDLFDRGLVGIGSLTAENERAYSFLTSEAVSSIGHLGATERGRVSISTLGSQGRFGNQLFQYACVKLYALRHGLSAEVPEWEGKELFNLPETFTEGLSLPELRFDDAAQDDRIIWEMHNPPIDIDLRGYFQELPECWHRHRSLLRRLFRLAQDKQEVIDSWLIDVTSGRDRPLIAIHVRRGDYRKLQDRPQFRLVPEEWYVAWLRGIWPNLHRPVLFVATDEPDVVLPHFREFELAAEPSAPERAGLSNHVFDFQVLRSADVLAVCNSSFSRMAAILGDSNQECFCPSFETQRFVHYEPWTDRRWTVRFGRPREEDLASHEIRERAVVQRLKLGELKQKLKKQAESNAKLREQNAKLREQNAKLREQNAKLRGQNAKLRERMGTYEREIQKVSCALFAVESSRSWRATAPLRKALRLLKRS